MRNAALLLLTTFVGAQEPAATAAAPVPHVVIDTVGPDGWRARLGPTNLGNLLASEQGRTLWQPGVMPFLGWWSSVLRFLLPLDAEDRASDEQLELAQQLLRANHLTLVRSATGYAERTWRWRLWW